MDILQAHRSLARFLHVHPSRCGVICHRDAAPWPKDWSYEDRYIALFLLVDPKLDVGEELRIRVYASSEKAALHELIEKVRRDFG